MSYRLIRYRTKPDRAEENERLIASVFQELREKAPEGIRYLALRLPDNGFMHFVTTQTGAAPLTSLPAFERFQDQIEQRQSEAPHVDEVTIIGDYRMLQVREVEHA